MNTYKMYNQHHYEVENLAIYFKSDIPKDKMIAISGCIDFLIEEIHGEQAMIDHSYLLEVLNIFYDVEKCKNATENTIEIDRWYAREVCCGGEYKKLMKSVLPKTEEFYKAIKNAKLEI